MKRDCRRVLGQSGSVLIRQASGGFTIHSRGLCDHSKSRAARSSVPAYELASMAAHSVNSCIFTDSQGVAKMIAKLILYGLAVSICALSVAAGDTPDGLAVVFSDDFEDGDISDWNLTTEGSGEVAAEQYPGPDWSMNINSPSGTSSRAQAVTPVFEMAESLDYDVSFEFAFETPIHWMEVFRSIHINTVIDDCPGDYCTFRCRYGGSNYIVDNLYPYTFYHIDYKVHPDSNEYDVYVGGVFKRTCDFDPSTIPFPQFRLGDFESGSANYGMAMYDDFVIAQVAAGVRKTKEPPIACGLRQSRPNPFKAATSIVFDVPQPNFVTVKIYDVSGGLVKTLVHRMCPASTYSVGWAADDEMGNRVVPGIYFARIETDGFADTEKMILLQ
jgi:hypothetical protein